MAYQKPIPDSLKATVLITLEALQHLLQNTLMTIKLCRLLNRPVLKRQASSCNDLPLTPLIQYGGGVALFHFVAHFFLHPALVSSAASCHKLEMFFF